MFSPGADPPYHFQESLLGARVVQGGLAEENRGGASTQNRTQFLNSGIVRVAAIANKASAFQFAGRVRIALLE